jgi:hypothetical protein
MSKEAVFTLKLETELRDAFMAEAETSHRPASQLVREFMREYVRKQREARDYDQWLRAKVQESIDDPQPSIPHETVVRETRAMIDRLANPPGFHED